MKWTKDIWSELPDTIILNFCHTTAMLDKHKDVRHTATLKTAVEI